MDKIESIYISNIQLILKSDIMPNLNLKNFAKIKDSDFDIKDITVFAGKPGTGKSYIMKFLYAYTAAVNSLQNGSYKMHYALMDSDEFDQTMLSMLRNGVMTKKIININEINIHIENSDYIEASTLLNNIKFDKDNTEEGMLQVFQNILNKLAKKQKKSLLDSEEEKFYLIFRNILTSIFGDINQINDTFQYRSKELELSYKENKLTINKLNIFNTKSTSIFVETPLILEFEKFLPTERFKVPYHIDSLLQELNKNDYSFTSEETDDFIHSFISSTKSIISGNISKGTQGFSFESSNGKTYNIMNASSGTKSIGLLQYLVKNRVIKKGSTLFWEEPEVHLHPTWQLKMIDLFIELMNADVKIVFSTHSPFMADYLNAKATKEKFRERVSFNLLCEEEGVVSNTVLNDDNWKLLQDELMGAFEDIMWQYL